MFDVCEGDGPLLPGFVKLGVNVKKYRFVVRNGKISDIEVCGNDVSAAD